VEVGAVAESFETGWLIERRNPSPEWLYVPDWFGFKWTSDSFQAIRFCRREDAEQIARMLENEDIHITEHQWG
jgi:hypothetical protein